MSTMYNLISLNPTHLFTLPYNMSIIKKSPKVKKLTNTLTLLYLTKRMDSSYLQVRKITRVLLHAN